jgi:hypothetical protein
MAKRFIDTGLFDDDWFMNLSKDAKILWLYFLTKCDHAGIIKLNAKLCKVQTGVNDLETVREQLGNRLVTVGEQLFFIPKFVLYQYPGFPDCKFNMAKSAISILEKYNLIKDGRLTVGQELVNSCGNGNGNGNKGGKGEKQDDKDPAYVKFYEDELSKIDDSSYRVFVEWLLGKNEIGRPFTKCLTMQDQIGYPQYLHLKRLSQENGTKISDKIKDLENGFEKYKLKSLNLTLIAWMKRK